MKKVRGKIVLVDDEKYEKILLELALHQKDWDVKIEYFAHPDKAFAYLKSTREEIFIVISDMNMREKNGLDFKKAIDQDRILRKKAIPFIFFSSSATREEVSAAYEYRIQGYFQKPVSIDEQAEQLNLIIRYWDIARHPHKI